MALSGSLGTDEAISARSDGPHVPDRRSTAAIAAALELRRNAAIGFGVGVLVAATAYAFRVGELAGPTADTRGSPVLFLMLAFVLAITVGALVTAALSLRAAMGLDE